MRKSILRNPQEANRARDYSPHAAQPATAPRFASARASYPVFLSLYDTLKLQIGWGWRGLVDAFRWDLVIGLMTRNVCFLLPFFRFLSVHVLIEMLVDCYCSDPEVRANTLKCFLLNGISLLSIYVFELLLHPLSRGEESREGARLQSKNGLHRSIGWVYHILWLLPVIGVSLYLNVRNLCVYTPLFNPRRRFCLHFFPFRFAGLVVLSYCQAHFYPATWTRVPLCWNDICHVAKRVHRIPQLACYVCVPCCHDRDVRLCLLCAGLCPRCRRCNRNHLLLLGRCVSERGWIL